MENNTNTSYLPSFQNTDEKANYNKLYELLMNSKIDKRELILNLGSFLTSKTLSRILFMDEIYKKIVDVPGIAMDCGCHWGQIGLLFSHFRAMYEPFNRHRKIVAFDTFQGFPSIDERDGSYGDMMVPGNLTTGLEYVSYLNELYQTHENLNPLSHLKKFEVVPGDASETVEKYLHDHPETIISLVYFDFDLYIPTKKVLEVIKPRLTKGSILAFDELNDEVSPGETLALNEVFPLNTISLKKKSITARASYFVVGE